MKAVGSSSSIGGNYELRHRHGYDGTHDATSDDSEIDQVVDHLVHNPEVESDDDLVKTGHTSVLVATGFSASSLSSSTSSLLSLLSKNSMPVLTHGDRTWVEAIQNMLWIMSAAFIIYYGDRHSNLLSILWSDQRIKRTALDFALAGILCSVGLHVYARTLLRRQHKPHEIIQFVSKADYLIFTLSIFSSCLFSFALWPIWNFLSLPLLFTLFMAFTIISTYWLSEPLVVHELMLRVD